MTVLHVDANFQSAELMGLQLPVEVRRPNMSLVGVVMTGNSLKVDAGEYLVILRLPAGIEMEAPVTIATGVAAARVRLELDVIFRSPHESEEVQRFVRGTLALDAPAVSGGVASASSLE